MLYNVDGDKSDDEQIYTNQRNRIIIVSPNINCIDTPLKTLWMCRAYIYFVTFTIWSS